MSSRALCFTLLLNVCYSAIAWGQSSVVAQLYGDGVHRYFARDYIGAEQSLTRAIEAGSQDPRAFYFRGLARAAYGGGGEFDYEEGARLEASGRVGVNVGMALTRIQGYERAKIEKARQDARLIAQQQRASEQRSVAPVINPPVIQTPESPSATDPFSGDGLRSNDVEVVPAPTETPTETPDADVDPFADEIEPSASESPADDAMEEPDVFSDPDAASEDSTPAEVEGTGDDPF